MIISIVYLIVSLILEVLMSNFFSSTFGSVSLFTTIYTIIALVVLYPHFNNDKKYFLLVIICGIVFDVVYTSTFVFNLILFSAVGMGIKILYNVFPENIFMTNLISYISIVIYHLFSFIVLSILSGINYNFILFFDIILGSIFMTIIYTSVSYFVLKYIFNRFKIKYVK